MNLKNSVTTKRKTPQRANTRKETNKMDLYAVWIRNNQGQEKMVECVDFSPRSAAETVTQSTEYSHGWEVFSVQVLQHDVK